MAHNRAIVNKYIKTDGKSVTPIPLSAIAQAKSSNAACYGTLTALRYEGEKTFAAIVNTIQKETVLVCLQYTYPKGIIIAPSNTLSTEEKDRLTVDSTNNFCSTVSALSLLKVIWVPCSKKYAADTSRMQLDRAVQLVLKAIRKSTDVYVTCNNHLNRTGAVIIRVLQELGLSLADAMVFFMQQRKNFILEHSFLAYVLQLEITTPVATINASTISSIQCPAVFDDKNDFVFQLPLKLKANTTVVAEDYMVTPKYDGERCYVIADKTHLFLVFRDNRQICIGPTASHFILDAEIVITPTLTSASDHVCTIFVFGCCMYDNIDYSATDFMIQQDCLQSMDIAQYDTQRFTFLLKCFTELSIYLRVDARTPILLKDVPIPLQTVLDETTQHLKKLPIDGLILQAKYSRPDMSPCIKLKPIRMHDIDCLVIKVVGRDSDLLHRFDYFLLLLLKTKHSQRIGTEWLPKNLAAEYIDVGMHTECADIEKCSVCVLLYLALNKIVETIVYPDHTICVTKLRPEKTIPNYDSVL